MQRLLMTKKIQVIDSEIGDVVISQVHIREDDVCNNAERICDYLWWGWCLHCKKWNLSWMKFAYFASDKAVFISLRFDLT